MPSGDPLWPEFWSLKELNAVRAEIPVAKWSAQYMQQPTSEEGAILKREWWQKWDRDKPPECEYVIISMDTAFTKNSRSDYTACTVWGVFYRDNADGMKSPNLILLDAFKERMEFPDLKAKAREIYREWQPDSFIIEAKASGLPLIHELRQAGIPVSDFTPTRATGDKIMRANSISDIFASGVVWAPERRWAEEVIEECASFPSSEHDDLVDAVIMAMMRYRQGGFVRLESDEDDEDLPFAKADYY
jgi:predicted phage terminase large subunit-like protein